MLTIASPILGRKEERILIKTLRSGQLAQGSIVSRLENTASGYVRSKYAVAVSSGTAGLHCSLLALGIKSGDEVITTPFTFVATINAILAVGARPVFVDIDPETFNIEAASIKSKITPKTKAVIPVSLYGVPYDADVIKREIEGKKISIIEDACQSLGATYKGRMSGSLGLIGVTSLYATKVITSGEGGIIFTNSKNLYELLKKIRHHGQSSTYEYARFGLNYRLTDLLASIGLAQFDSLELFLKRRRFNALVYNRLLSDLPGINVPRIPKDLISSYCLYTIRVEKPLERQGLVNYLLNKKIRTGIYYPQPLHLTWYLKKILGYKKGSFPQAEKASQEVLSLPVHPKVSENDIKMVCKYIKDYAKKNS